MRYLALIVPFLLLACCGIESDGEQSVDASGAKDGAKTAQATEPTATKPETGKPETGKPETGNGAGLETEPEPETEEEALQAAGGGWDAGDLRAMRSAKQMLAAEKRLKELLKAGKIKGLDRIIPFEEISSWPYQDGLKGMPKRIKKLSGKKVLMTGFMLPIDEVENIKEFLLVQSLWGCCYGTPPDINGVVRVVMQGGKRIDYEFEPVKIIGEFTVGPTIEDGFCVDIYQLKARSVEVIK